MEFVEIEHLREVCLDLPVSLLSVLHAKWLKYEKLIELIASFHLSCLCWSRWNSNAVVALLVFSPLGEFQEGVIKTLTFLIPTRYVVVSVTVWGESFGHFDKGTFRSLDKPTQHWWS